MRSHRVQQGHGSETVIHARTVTITVRAPRGIDEHLEIANRTRACAWRTVDPPFSEAVTD